MSVRSFKYFWLLAALLLLLVLSPFVEGVAWAEPLFGVLFTCLLIAAVNAARTRRWHLIVAGSIASIWIMLRWPGSFLDSTPKGILLDVIIIALLYLTIGIVLHRIIRVKETDFDLLCGAVSIYLLLGVTWAVTYRVIESLAPGSFALASPELAPTWTQFLYFSLTTLTTLGYGDITPMTPVAAIWSTLEAVAGTLYIALLIARLLSLYRN
ncbi:MAG: ion channel [Alphaproteobacteria bacterium]|nr:ion channel [Alphaproteobacteria bacterium]